MTRITSPAAGIISGVVTSGVAAAGKVPVASSSSAATWSYPPGYEIGYDEITAPVTVASATEATGTTVITCAAHTFDGGAVLCEFFAPKATPGLADIIAVSLFEATTEIGIICQISSPTALTDAQILTGKLRFTPSAAAHTYTVTAIKTTNNGTISCDVGGTGKLIAAYVRFTKV